jgi:hypothetical protein
MAVGAGMGLLAAGLADCPDNPSGSCPGFRTSGALTSVAIYTALGVALDAMVTGRTTLYVAPVQSRRSDGAAPGAAIGFSMKW